ncbi:MAG: tetratricopeptide repeat protein [Bacteroidota bacterium]
MRIINIIILIFLAFSVNSMGSPVGGTVLVANDTTDSEKLDQNFKNKYTLAESYINSQSFSEATVLLKQLDSIMPSNSNVNYKLGICYFNMNTDKKDAISCFEKAVLNITDDYKSNYLETDAPALSLYYLAKSYHNEYMFEDAKKTFEKYKGYLSPGDTKETKETDYYISMCENGSKLMKTSLNPQIDILSAEINTSNSDHPLFASNDNSILIYSTYDKTVNEKNNDNTTYYLSSLEGQKWSSPVKIDNDFNVIASENSSKLSLRKKEFFITKSVNGNKELYSIAYKDGKWTDPVKLGPSVNTKAVETNASISPDGSTLYFSSNRDGGYGGYDIYACERLSDGSWSKPANLGSQVNTPNDEQSPYISIDAATLYFSSQGHNTMGGYDIFFSTLSDEGIWPEAENIGYPINTPQDDLFYIPSSDETKAFYTSSKDGGQGNEDIYIILFN